MQFQTTELKTSDGYVLHVVTHQVESPRGTVLIVHGLGEHSGRYDHVVEVLNAARLNVVRFDHRGHGTSTGPRGHVDRYENFLDDLSLVTQDVISTHPDQRVILYGHSMGGGVVANWVLKRFNQDWDDRLVGVVLSAPWFTLTDTPPSWKYLLIRSLSTIAPRLSIPTNIRVRDLCRDPEAIRQFENDPLNHGRISMRLALECHVAGRWALEHAANWPLPLLAIHGTADPITSPLGTQQFCDAIPCSRYIPLDHLVHEPHHDPYWREILNHVTDWIIKRYNFAKAA